MTGDGEQLVRAARTALAGALPDFFKAAQLEGNRWPVAAVAVAASPGATGACKSTGAPLMQKYAEGARLAKSAASKDNVNGTGGDTAPDAACAEKQEDPAAEKQEDATAEELAKKAKAAKKIQAVEEEPMATKDEPAKKKPDKGAPSGAVAVGHKSKEKIGKSKKPTVKEGANKQQAEKVSPLVSGIEAMETEAVEAEPREDELDNKRKRATPASGSGEDRKKKKKKKSTTEETPARADAVPQSSLGGQGSAKQVAAVRVKLFVWFGVALLAMFLRAIG